MPRRWNHYGPRTVPRRGFLGQSAHCHTGRHREPVCVAGALFGIGCQWEPVSRKGNAHARGYTMAAPLSNIPQTVSPRTLTAENACRSWIPAETAARCPHTCQGVKRATGPLRGLSALISVAHGMSSIDSAPHGFYHLAAHSNAHKQQTIAAHSHHKQRRTVSNTGAPHLTPAGRHKQQRTVDYIDTPHLTPARCHQRHRAVRMKNWRRRVRMTNGGRVTRLSVRNWRGAVSYILRLKSRVYFTAEK